MSWFRAALDIADIAISVNNAYRIGQLQKMQQTAEQIQIVQSIILDYLFRANQIREDLLFYKTRKPIAVVATLYYLEAEINEANISPDMFTDISDKEYVASTLRNIKQDRVELIEHFSPDQRELAETTGSALHEIEDILFVIDTYDDMMQLRNLQLEQQNLKQHQARMNRREWKASNDRIETEMKIIANNTAPDHFIAVYNRHGRPPKQEFMKKCDDMVLLIKNVFGDEALVPRLSLGDVISEKLGTSQGSINPTNTTTAISAGTSTIVNQPPSDGRVACPVCGYRNTKYRKTCKNCRSHL